MGKEMFQFNACLIILLMGQKGDFQITNILIYNHINQTMFKALVLTTLLCLALSTLQVYSPECAVKLSPQPIPYTLSNFGDIPYGQIFLGKIQLPSSDHLCSMQGEKHFNNKDPKTRVILLVKRGECKFTEKVINAQNLGADLIIIYDNQISDSSQPKVIMKNDGHGHLAKIPSLFVSNKQGMKLKINSKNCDFPVVKVGFEIEQKQVSQVILWLDANNRESFILARQFYKNGYYKALEGKVKISVRFRIDTQCKDQLFCKATDCVGLISEKYCRNVQRGDYDNENTLNGVAVIEEQLREYFLWEELAEKDKIEWWKYMTKFDKDDCIEKKDVKDCSFYVMKELKISQSIITKVDAQVKKTLSDVKESQPPRTILKETAVEAAQLGIYFYPQATINNRNFYGLFKASEVFQMICDSLIKPPKECITFIKNNNQIDTNDETGGLWKNVLIALLVMTAGFFIALFVYTRIIRKEVDQQLSIEVNKMVENYVNLADKKKNNSAGNSYSKFDS